MTADDWSGGIPGWAKAVAAVGIPGVIALALVWMIGKEIPNIIRMGQRNHDIMVEIKQGQDEGQRMLREQNANGEALYRMMQRICANTAKNDSDQRACFDK
jgi:methyl-accepting chemotaxis protein